MENKCSFCGKINPPDTSVCDACNCKLPQAPQIGLGTAPSGAPLSDRVAGALRSRAPRPPRQPFKLGCVDSCARQVGIGCGVLLALMLLPIGCAIFAPKATVVPVVDSTPTPVPTLATAPLVAPTTAFPVVGPTVEPQAPGVVGSDEVWVNSRSGIFHRKGSQWYGTTESGFYTSEAAAIAAGHRESQR